MKNAITTSTFFGLLISAPFALAGEVPLPLEIGGIAAVAGLTLIIATQLIKRRK
jgi:hypothetical protein